MRWIALVLLLAAMPTRPVCAQSLAEIAERERKRREELGRSRATAGRSFSDHDLAGSWTTWRTFERPADGFSVQFPSAPAVSDDLLATPDGPVARKVYRAVKDKREYLLMVADLAPALVQRLGAEAVFDLAEAQARQDFTGQPLNSFGMSQDVTVSVVCAAVADDGARR